MAQSLITTTTQNTEFDPYFESTMMNIMDAATQEANKPYAPYKGQRVAGFTPDELKAMETIRNSYLQEQPYFDKARTAMDAGMNELNNTGGTWDSPTATRYMNPYLDNVAKNTTDELVRNQQAQLSSLRANNARTGAFGGSRNALAETELLDKGNRTLSSSLADLYSQGYDNAYDKFDKDRAAGINRAGAYGAMASGLTGLAGAQTTYTSGQASNLSNIGNQQRNLNQTSLDTAYNDFTAQRDYNKGQIAYLSNILSGQDMSKFATGETKTVTPQYPQSDTTLGNITAGLGLASNLYSAFGKVFGSQEAARGGLIKQRKFAEGGVVQEDTSLSGIPLDNLVRTISYVEQQANKGGLGSTTLAINHARLTKELARRRALLGLGNPTSQPTQQGEGVSDYPQPYLGEGVPEEEEYVQDIGYAPGMSQNIPQPSEIEVTNTEPVKVDGRNSREAVESLYPEQEPSFFDTLAEPNPLLMAGLGMLAAGAENNPYDTWGAQAKGVKDALTSYDERRQSKDEQRLERQGKIAGSLNDAARNAIDMRGQDIQRELGVAQLTQASQKAIADYEKAMYDRTQDGVENRLAAQGHLLELSKALGDSIKDATERHTEAGTPQAKAAIAAELDELRTIHANVVARLTGNTLGTSRYEIMETNIGGE